MGSAGYAYDDDGIITQAGDLTLTPDPATGQLTQTRLGNTSTTYGYDGYGNLEDYTAQYESDSLYRGLLSVHHTRDTFGRITGHVESIDDGNGLQEKSYTYEYDGAGRLQYVKDAYGAVLSTYEYDHGPGNGNGNRTSYTGADGTTYRATYDGQDRLLAYGGNEYTYTPTGQLLTKSWTDAEGFLHTTEYEYDALDNLLSVTLPDGKQLEYVVDGANRRIGKRVDGTLVQGFLYEGERLVAELDGNNQVVSRFVYGSSGNVPDYLVKGGVTYRLISDHLGSPRLIVDTATGEVVQRLEYDEYGRVLEDTNPGFQPFGYAGGVYDRDTELVRFGARDYDAETGRWTAKDPIGFEGGDTNLYGYVLNDPLNLTDPAGTFAFLAVLLVAWGVTEVGLSIYDAYSTGETLLDPCVSGGGKLFAGGMFVAGGLLPGGGYSGADDAVRLLPNPGGRWTGTGDHPEVDRIANLIEDRYPGHVLRVDAERDIETANAIVQVNAGNGQGLTRQIKRWNAGGKPVIGYAPYMGHAANSINRAGGIAAGGLRNAYPGLSPDETLLEIIAP